MRRIRSYYFRVGRTPEEAMASGVIFSDQKDAEGEAKRQMCYDGKEKVKIFPCDHPVLGGITGEGEEVTRK